MQDQSKTEDGSVLVQDLADVRTELKVSGDVAEAVLSLHAAVVA